MAVFVRNNKKSFKIKKIAEIRIVNAQLTELFSYKEY